jgi:cytochrome d ubiquinol oxidase subunit II
MTVTQAAAGRTTLVALIIAVCAGAVILLPSLALLFTLFLRGRLDTPEHHAADGTAAADGVPAATAGGALAVPRARARAGAAVAGLVAGAGLLVFATPAWTHAVGVLCLALCAVAVFTLAAPPPGPD